MRQEEMKLYLDRCRRFWRRCEPDLFIESIPVRAEFARTAEPVPFGERLKLEYKPIEIGEDWGEAWDSAWFHLQADLPEAWAGREIAMQLNLSGESLIFNNDGTPMFALTGNSVINANYTKDICQFPKSFQLGGRLDLYVEAAANSLFGVFMDEEPHRLIEKPEGYFPGKVKAMKIGLFNRELWQMRLDFEMLLLYFDTLPENDYRRRKLLHAMNEAVNLYADNPANAAKARGPLQEMLRLPALASALTVTAVGHAHIDTGWLWPVRETIRKCARTFSNQLDMIEKYPGYVFGASQAQHYAFVKEHYPSLYEKIKARVADGSWEIQGGMWVEADCNLTSGESLVRQFLHGKNFFMDEFGFDVKNLWLPDVFGYSAALPQIIRKSGCNYFLTQKISWNQFNEFPHNTFIWEGIDGTEVLTHFPPENTYNAFVSPTELVPAQNRFKEADVLDEFLSLFGIGDGGGGPKEEFIEHALRLGNMEGMPKVRLGRADAFFERLAKHSDKLYHWVGELYLEMHRGTLTTQARTKRNNRKLEQLLAATEFICSLAPRESYPAEALDKAWKKLLINQFHDIIPGSSITKVYEVTEKEHAELFKVCEELIADAFEAIGSADENAVSLINTLPYAYNAPVELPASWANCAVTDCCGNEFKVQVEDGKVYAQGEIPADSVVVLRRGAPQEQPALETRRETVLENELVRYEFNAAGELVRGFDKEAGREILRDGEKGNVFSLYVDRPNTFEAWDVDIFYDQEERTGAEIKSISEVVCGPVRSSVKLVFAIGNSEIRQEVSLRAGSKRLDFATEVEWHEVRRMLRVLFPVDVMTSEAAFDIQYGYVKRPTHGNTSWDSAKFEVVGHRYVDFSERGYGVAILNDCKYGHRTNQGNLDLCLLRSPKYPDWNADQGRQVFTYALLPHTGELAVSNVMQEAAILNRAPIAAPGVAVQVQAPFRVLSGTSTLEVLKKAEKSDDLVIRFVETRGGADRIVLKTNLENVKLIETNLVEWTDGAEYEFDGDNCLELAFKPFELRTFKVVKK